MPAKSLKQLRWIHTKAARAKGFTPAKVREWEKASKGLHLPKRVKHKKKR